MVFEINIVPHMLISLCGLIWIIEISYIITPNLFSIKNSCAQFYLLRMEGDKIVANFCNTNNLHCMG
jgi:hypothetical protein